MLWVIDGCKKVYTYNFCYVVVIDSFNLGLKRICFYSFNKYELMSKNSDMKLLITNKLQ